MTRRFDDYHRLARGLWSCSSLWLGQANVLYVHGTGVLLPFKEEYHRFDLRRIQAVAVVPTHTGWVLSLIFGFLAFGVGGVGWLALFSAGAASGVEEVLLQLAGWPAAAVGAIGLVLLVVNLILGPTCRFQIQTATRRQSIRACRRLRVARRALAQLAPALAHAQGAPAPAPHPAAESAPPLEPPVPESAAP
jgi:hypothetical protein